MSLSQPLRCRCGKVRGEVRDTRISNRGICYCRNCQAFAAFLDKATDTLDANGETQVIQTIQANAAFHQGTEHLACMRLTQDGLVRTSQRRLQKISIFKPGTVLRIAVQEVLGSNDKSAD